MYSCPSCGLAIPASQTPPPYCPHCEAPLPSDTSGPGAPPSFGGSPDDNTDEPIFGTLGESSTEMLRPDSLAPLRRRQPPPAPAQPGARTGPPSIGLEELERHNELDLGNAGSLELDVGRRGSRAASEPPPEISLPHESGLEFLTPVGFGPDESGVDLPSPVGLSLSSVTDDSNAYLLDLPAPVQTPSPPAFSRPAAPAATRPGATATSTRAAAPSSAAPSAARTAAPSSAAPAARAAAPSSAAPAGRAAAPSSAAPAARSAAPPHARPAPPPPPSPADSLSYDDLLATVDLDLPMPVGDERLDLPIPVDHQGVTSHAAQSQSQMLAPVGLDVTPIELGITPAKLDVTPAKLDVRPKLAGNEMAPHESPARRPERAPASGVPQAVPRPAPSGPAAATSPAVGKPDTRAATTTPRKPVSRGVILGAAGVLLVGLAAAGVLYSGVLDPEDPEPTALRGGGNRQPATDEAGDTTPPDPKATPSGAPAERAPAVLAKLAAHTPEAYLQAITATREAGDTVGAAEAGLLLALHYGPNPARAEEATAALQPHASVPAGFVQRVVGLAALVAGDHAGAEAALGGDEPRTRLYRGWLRLAQGRLDEAKADADTMLAALPDELGARHLALAVQAERDAVAAVAALQAAVDGRPQQALRALLATTAIETGQLALARTMVDALDPAATDDPGVQAWTHVQKAHVLKAQGDHDGALAAFDRALELQPKASAIQLARIRTLVAAKRFSDASAAVSALVRERPQDTEAQLLQAEVAIQGGDGDIALQVLDKLAVALPKDARVMLAKGEVHAMRLEVDEGQTAFAAARALEPKEHRAAVGEAGLLADAKRLPDALAVLEAARTAAAGAGLGHEVARLWLAKAKLHAKANERNAALEAFDRALEAWPGDNEAQLRRGVLRLEAGQAAEGRADLVEVFERTGGYPGLAAPLGRLYVLESDFDALERLVGDRLRGEATADDLLAIGARLRLHQGRTADARVLLELALARHPADWEAHMLLAQVLILEGNASEALAEIERSRPPDPQPERMLQHGKILEFNARHDDAIPEYQRALAIDPELHEARFLYGRMLHYKGGHAKAISELRKVLDAPRAKTAAWYPEVWLNIGVALQAQGKYEEAIESLRHATDLDPKLGEAWAKAGKFHGDRNKHAEAITALEKAIEVGPKDAYWYADALMDLGRAQSKAGRTAAARKSLEEFLKVAPADDTSRAEADRLLGEL
jgi:tetratricopeptide (TPR) repeat protein